MTEKTGSAYVIAQAYAVTISNRTGPRNVEVPADRPGIVIFLHGVNDPGANYDTIERGLCEGLNERLNRPDLTPGEYGAVFKKAQKRTHADPDFDRWKAAKYDPDTYLYQRTEIDEGRAKTNSMFIPFYWGYRAAPAEIKGGEKTPATLRGQYQDIHGNRLSKHFAKGGGMFNNATTNIPAMFDPGWTDNALNRLAGLKMSDYQYSGQSPHRHYFVLAAQRLAMLVREIRRVDPNETITVMAHSQGTLITLLAQALLAQDGERCADCVIMVDTPYSLTEPFAAQLVQPSATAYTVRGKLNTLLNIVRAVTDTPHAEPPLDELQVGNAEYGGRTGKRWSPAEATRLDKDGSAHVFAERDNRGKVYLYFCTDDATVDLPNIKGIGTHGVPDTIEERWNGTEKFLGIPTPSSTTLKAMDALKEHRFYQRLWSRKPIGPNGEPPLVGSPPGYHGGTIGGGNRKFDRRLINAEAIAPPYRPNLYGDEAIKGDAHRAGKDKPDHVARNTLLGNPNVATVYNRPIRDLPGALHGDRQAIVDWFNSRSTDTEDHIDSVILSTEGGLIYMRHETPNEARERLEIDEKAWDSNSYHSAILRDADNIRRVAAMDVAIGQAKSLDHPDMRRLLIAIADWKIRAADLKLIKDNPYYATRLDARSRELIEACHEYYVRGTFPSRLVPEKAPALVDAETFQEREKKR